MIVVDTNVLTALVLTSTLTPLAQAVERADRVWIVPSLWRFEFQNILATSVRAGQLTLADTIKLWQCTATLMADNETDPSPASVLELAAHHSITAYDATFAALALELGVPCVTEDREMQRKLPAVAVSMKHFVESRPGLVCERPAAYRTRRRSRKT